MKGLEIYKWIAGSKNDFTKPFKNPDNYALYDQAKTFWEQLNQWSVIIIAIFIIVGIALAWGYYKPYNEYPRRHYLPSHWLVFCVATIILSFVITLGFECLIATPKLKGAFILELRIALGNAIYAFVVYFITSIVWCNWLSTNAYPIFKIKK